MSTENTMVVNNEHRKTLKRDLSLSMEARKEAIELIKNIESHMNIESYAMKKHTRNVTSDVYSIKKNLDSLIRNLNKHRQQSIDTVEGHNTQDGDIIDTQNNFYSSITFKPLVINEPVKIKCYRYLINTKETILMFVISFFAFLFFWLFTFNFQVTLIVTCSMLSFVVSFSLCFFLNIQQFFMSRTLILSQDKITLNDKKGIIKETDYKLRGVLKEYRFLTFDIHIYKEDLIRPFISCKLDNIHDANAIEQLIKSNIQRSDHHK